MSEMHRCGCGTMPVYQQQYCPGLCDDCVSGDYACCARIVCRGCKNEEVCYWPQERDYSVKYQPEVLGTWNQNNDGWVPCKEGLPDKPKDLYKKMFLIQCSDRVFDTTWQQFASYAEVVNNPDAAHWRDRQNPPKENK